MNKKQCFQSMWIDLEKRPPPEDKNLYLGWNEKTQQPMLASGIELNFALKNKNRKKIKKNAMLNNSYYHITKWIKVYI